MSDWEFDEGATIREEHEQYAAGGVPLGKNEETVRYRLRDVDSDERFYHVESPEGKTNLMSAGALERTYEQVDDE